jgi:DNA-binding NarL/FixJ family response regulator
MQPSHSTSSSTLTPRQYEIAQFVAAGLTNREIAARLGLAPGTVSAHIGNILWCLRLTRRRQIAAWVIEEAWPAPMQVATAAIFSCPVDAGPRVVRVIR